MGEIHHELPQPAYTTNNDFYYSSLLYDESSTNVWATMCPNLR